MPNITAKIRILLAEGCWGSGETENQEHAEFQESAEFYEMTEKDYKEGLSLS